MVQLRRLSSLALRRQAEASESGEEAAATALLEKAAARLRTSSTPHAEASAHELLLALPCVLVRQLRLCSGLFALSRHALHFLPNSEQLLDGARERSWPLPRLREVRSRRYLLQLRALELFWGGGAGGLASAFFSFESGDARHAAQRALLALPLPALLAQHSRKPDAGPLLQPDPAAWTRAWQARQLSNYDYLARLNSLAGRTYWDLTQYPVQAPLPRAQRGHARRRAPHVGPRLCR